jgi:multidrug resistance efflux pump
MLLAVAMTVGFAFLVWLIFFKLKWIKFSIMWGILCGFFFLHILPIFMIGLRFVTPYSTDVKVIQHTIQLVPRLPEPTLVTKVYVEPDVPVKKGDKLFEFDRRPYQYKVNSVRAQLAAAKQHVRELKAQLDAATSAVAQARAQRVGLKSGLDAATANVAEARAKRELASCTLQISQQVSRDDAGAISKLRLDQSRGGMAEAEAAVKVALANEAQAQVAFRQIAEAAIQIALANEEKARLAYTSDINGENTTVAQLKADLALAEYYLDNTIMVAPEDGRIVNLQVQEGMVSGIFRAGGIASFIVDADRYALATFYQENLKYLKDGQPVELALDLYPGQIVKGKVKASGGRAARARCYPAATCPSSTRRRRTRPRAVSPCRS